MSAKKIILQGIATNPVTLEGTDEFVIEQTFVLSSDRSVSQEQVVEDADEKILQLTLQDDTQWIGELQDLKELHGISTVIKRGSDESKYSLPDHLNSISKERSITSTIRNKRLDVITGKLKSKLPEKIGQLADQRLMPSPGLFRISSGFELARAEALTSGNYLLLLHGTFSSVTGSFEDLKDNIWYDLFNSYHGNTLGFNHYTISESPYKNALDLINTLPAEIELDLISFSRGGLIADILARCDYRNNIQGFTPEEIDLIKKHDTSHKSNIAKELIGINKAIRNRRIKVNKNVRIGCPASGTLLLAKRLDHFLNFFLNSIQKAIGGRANVIFGVVKSFLLQIVKSRHNAKSFPGLWAMVPDSLFQKINNNDFELANDLICITGDAEVGGGLFQSLKVILTNLYYWTENDFVVNTKSMTRGLYNRNALYAFHIESNDINHFLYFKNKQSTKAIQQGIINSPDQLSEFTNIQLAESQRGIGLALSIIDLKEVSATHVSGAKPIIVLIPGIMGSNIHHQTNRIWVDHKELKCGGFGKYLQIDQPNIESLSAIGRVYTKFKNYFEDDFDVVIFPFDWRKSLSVSAISFNTKINNLLTYNQPVTIVSHSMGGLLVRQWKIDFPASWNQFHDAGQTKWIMLGTPWMGSYLVMEVLTGHSKRVKQIAQLDKTHDKLELLNIFNQYPGIFELLPIDDQPFEEKTFWEKIFKVVGEDEMEMPPSRSLDDFKNYKDKVLANNHIPFADAQIIYYIAGHKLTTTHRYEINDRNELQYFKTSEGDGSVAWEYGIHKDLLETHTYYSRVGHTMLANRKIIFQSIRDIIYSGKTDHLFHSKPSYISRGGESLIAEDPVVDFHDPNLVFDNLFDTDTIETGRVTTSDLQVTVFNGDMKWANSPMLIGHFENDGIVSAERTLDVYLKGKLFERNRMGFYPGKIGEQAIILDRTSFPPGAIIVGLGNKSTLSGYELSTTIKMAVLKYALFFRDNFKEEENRKFSEKISTLLVGSAYGQLSILESIRGILLGIQEANQIIAGLENDLVPIKYVEFVDYYEDNAFESYKILKQLSDDSSSIRIQLTPRIIPGYGARKRMLRRESRSWWQSITTIMETNDPTYPNPYLKFSAYSGSANVSLENVYSNLELALYLAEELSQESIWDQEDSKTIFELLLPNNYKDFVRNHRNIEWKMDVQVAQFPWEMFHDYNYGDNPTFVESGLIRQLYSSTANQNPAIVTANKALVIGDPVYNVDYLGQLEGALEEGKAVNEILSNEGVEIKALLRKKPMDIIKAFYANEYKILHIASHGIYDPKAKRVGIVIGDGQFLSPGDIAQMTAIPEFVFINCCYSGFISGNDEVFSRHKHKLAANVGTQFIEMGVKAVVIAGWAVNDSAALLFARKLYECLYQGDYFGDAVRKARFACYQEFRQTNTWGAYQCYGDQFYRLVKNIYYTSGRNSNSILREFTLALDNLISDSQSMDLLNGGANALADLRGNMERLIERTQSLEIYSSEIKEREALIYTNLGLYPEAIDRFRNLINAEDADYSIRILDKYCNIRSKLLANQYLSREQFGKLTKVMKDEMDHIEKDLLLVKELGHTYSRLCSMGSTYKRFALIDQNNRIEHLKKAANYYLEGAYEIGLEDRGSIYPITSYVTLSLLASARYKSQFYREIGTTLDEFLGEWLKRTAAHEPNRSDVWDQLAELQLALCSFLASDTHLKDQIDSIIKLYRTQLSRCFSAKDLVGEIEHIQFLEHMLKSKEKADKRFTKYEKHVEELNRVRTFLEGFR